MHCRNRRRFLKQIALLAAAVPVAGLGLTRAEPPAPARTIPVAADAGFDPTTQLRPRTR